MKAFKFIVITILIISACLFTACSKSEFTITFNTNGGSLIEQITVIKGEGLTLPEKNPTKDGYIFDGWYIDEKFENGYDPNAEIINSITLNAKWKIEDYTINYEENGGETIENKTYNIETETFDLAVAVKTGYTFQGWYTNNEFTGDKITSIVKGTFLDKTLYAKWTINGYAINFESNGGSSVTAISQDYNTAVTKPENPTKTGYTFVDWYTDNTFTTKYTFTTMPANNINVYAKWNINKYTISFEENGGSVIADITQDYNTDVLTPVEPVKTGYSLVAWYTESNFQNIYNFTTMPAENITLYASWSKKLFTISFEENGGSEVSDITLFYDSTVSKPENPTKTGYTFVDWYKESNLTTPYTFTKIPAENITIYAKWNINDYTIGFESNGGSNVTAITQDYNTTVTKPINPTKTGYTFVDWYTDNTYTTVFVFDKMPAVSITLQAKWQLTDYTLSFNCNYDGAAAIEDRIIHYKDIIGTLPNIERSGYKIENWYYIDEANNIYDVINAETIYNYEKNITIKAEWITVIQGFLDKSRYLDDVYDMAIYTKDYGSIKNQLYNKYGYYPEINSVEEMYYINNSDYSKANDLFAVNFKSIEDAKVFEQYLRYYLNADGYSYISTTISGTTVISGSEELLDLMLTDEIYYENYNYYAKNETGYKLLRSYDYHSDIVLNSTVNGLPLTEIGYSAFYNVLSLRSIIIPETVKVIDDSAFSYCYNLYNVIFSGNSSLERIGSYAFAENNIIAINIPDNVTVIEDYAFQYCPLRGVNFTENSKLETIGREAFAYCSYLIEFTIPVNVTLIKPFAFASDNLLSRINLNSKLEEIQERAFSYTNLTGFIVPASVRKLGEYLFEGGVLTSVIFEDSSMVEEYLRSFNGTPWFTNLSDSSTDFIIKDSILIGYKGSSAEVVIPEGVVTIGASTFLENSDMTSLTLPSTLKYINKDAFNTCSNLTSLTINGSSQLKVIDEGAFSNCSITSFNIPSSVEYINLSALTSNNLTEITVDANNQFYSSNDGVLFNKNQTDLLLFPRNKAVNNSTYTIPSTVIDVADDSFMVCQNVLTLIVPVSVKYIGKQAFRYSSVISVMFDGGDISLEKIDDYAFDTTSIGAFNLPDSVKYIGSYAFSGCSSLTTFAISETSLLNYIGDYAFCKTPLTSFYVPDGVNTIKTYTFSDTSLNSIRLPQTLTRIEEGAFINCKFATLAIPDSVNYIGPFTFQNNNNLTNITLPLNIDTLNMYIFDNCVLLGSDTNNPFVIPSQIKYILYNAFSYCVGLTSIIIPDTVLYLGREAFSYCTELTSATISNSLNIINPLLFYNCTKLANVVLSDNTKVIDCSAFENCYLLSTFTIPTNLAVIGDNAFKYTIISSVSLPQTLTIIGQGAFAYTELTSIIVPNSVEEIKDEAFINCSELTSATLSLSIRYIGANLFNGCAKLETIDIPVCVSEIRNGAFNNCSLLSSVNFYSDTYLKTIGAESFRNCVVLNLVLPGSIELIGDYAFANCPLITSLNLTSNLKSIGDYSFDSCLGLTSIVIPEGITVILEKTFNNCTNLANITFPESLYNISYYGLRTTKWFTDQPDGYVYANHVLICYKGSVPADTNLIIPEGVKGIGYCALSYNINSSVINIKSISLPSTLVYIGIGAFEYNYGLLSVDFADANINFVGYSTFLRCTNLASLNLPEGLTMIPNHFVSNCTSLTTLTIPSTVTRIDTSNPFSFCNTMTDLYITRSYNPTDYYYFNTFVISNSSTVIHVPEDSYFIYKQRWGGLPNKVTCDKFVVTFNTLSYGTVPSQLVAENDLCLMPETVPSYEGYEIENWYIDSNLITTYDFNTPVTADLTLYAKFVLIGVPPITMTFDSQGGTSVEPITKGYSGTVTEPFEPYKTGYVFAGWFTDVDYTEEIIFPYILTGDITVYAKWEVSNGKSYVSANLITLDQTENLNVGYEMVYMYYVPEYDGGYHITITADISINYCFYIYKFNCESLIDTYSTNESNVKTINVYLKADRLYYFMFYTITNDNNIDFQMSR